jgi:DNA-binding response OmpR family regulator
MISMKRRAVIFDDEKGLRFALWHFFAQRNYEVITFPEPGVCPLHVPLQCACPDGSSCSDLIMSDVNMLGANGIDFVEQLITRGCRQRHFALMSGAFSEADRARGAKLGCALFDKPLDMEAVTAWVEDVEKSTPPDRMLFDWMSKTA